MRAKRLIPLAVLLAVWGAAATAGSLVYPAVPWEQFPDREWSLEKLDPVVAYPNWDPSAFRFESYFEAEQSLGQDFGVATCQVYDPLWIAAAYYSPDGNIYLAHEPFHLAAGQRISLSWQLPPRESGISRLLLLASQPTQEDWLDMLANPVTPAVPQVHVVAEQWLGRNQLQYAQLPWMPVLRGASQPPAGYDYTSWPACRAWLQPDLSLATKDCWVQTDAQPGFILDEYGPAGRWTLDWSSELTLGCQLPAYDTGDAVLLLTGKAKPDFAGAGLPELDVSVNQWEIQQVAMQGSLASGLQQYAVEVGQYLQAGENMFSLRINAISGGILQVDSVELWVR